MKIRTLVVALGVFVGMAQPAAAACAWQGVSYGVGHKMCQPGGWLMECTVAGYWKAIGQCRAPDMTPLPNNISGKLGETTVSTTTALVGRTRQIATTHSR